MKTKAILILIVTLLPAGLRGQNLDDALRYSKVFYMGTARFNGMSGAFTALGGDLSAVAINPAAIAVYRSTEFSVSPNLLIKDISNSFGGGNNNSNYSYFNLGQAGFVTAITMGSGSGLAGLSFSYSYNGTNDFNVHSVINGISEESSMSDYWASLADGYTTGQLIESGPAAAYMAYETYMIDTLPDYWDRYGSVFSYYGEMDPEYGQKTTREIDNSGYTGEHTIAGGANIGNKLYLGLGFGITTLSYISHYQHSEVDDAEMTPDFVDFTYIDHFDAYGTGWNFKVGMIVRPIESLRLGFSFTTPTWYHVNETYFSNLTAFFDGDTPEPGDDGEYEVSQDMMTYAYDITTPYRINAGAALQIGTIALVSADYEYINYANARLSHGSDGYDFNPENEELTAELEGASNFRVGAELRFGSLYLRGGGRFYGSSFKEGTLNSEFGYSGFSGGIGYRQKNFFIDFSYSRLSSEQNYLMYPDPYLDPVIVNEHDQFITTTVGFKF